MIGDFRSRRAHDFICYLNNNSFFNCIFSYELIPRFESGIFYLHNYSVKRKSSVNVVYSDVMLSCGNEWRLKVYLNGNDKARDEYLSVFLEMTKGPSAPTNFEYRIELLNQMSRSISEAR